MERTPHSLILGEIYLSYGGADTHPLTLLRRRLRQWPTGACADLFSRSTFIIRASNKEVKGCLSDVSLLSA